MQERVKPVFELLDWDNALIPETLNDLTFHAESTGGSISYRSQSANANDVKVIV
jgi:hypothetical protein